MATWFWRWRDGFVLRPWHLGRTGLGTSQEPYRPVPLRLTLCGLFVALSVNHNVSVLAPKLLGANFTLTVQDSRRVSLLPVVQPDDLILKSVPVVIVTELIVIGPALTFRLLSVMLKRLERPTLTLPNEIEVGQTFAITGCGVEVAVGVGVWVGATVGVAVMVAVAVAVGV